MTIGANYIQFTVKYRMILKVHSRFNHYGDRKASTYRRNVAGLEHAAISLSWR